MRFIKLFFFTLIFFMLSMQISFAQSGTNHTQTVILSVPAMTCPVCPITVKKALEQVVGVSTVKTDIKEQVVTVIYDPQKATTQQLIHATTKAGYPSTVKKDKSNEKIGVK